MMTKKDFEAIAEIVSETAKVGESAVPVKDRLMRIGEQKDVPPLLVC